MRCSKCQKAMEEVLWDGARGDWLKLMHYFEHELAEGEITNETYEVMTDALCRFRPEDPEDKER